MDVWGLLPHQPIGLSVLTSGVRTEDFSLSLMGVSVRAGPERVRACWLGWP